jgi:hypothetical protein
MSGQARPDPAEASTDAGPDQNAGPDQDSGSGQEVTPALENTGRADRGFTVREGYEPL